MTEQNRLHADHISWFPRKLIQGFLLMMLILQSATIRQQYAYVQLASAFMFNLRKKEITSLSIYVFAYVYHHCMEYLSNVFNGRYEESFLYFPMPNAEAYPACVYNNFPFRQ